jgi:ribonuclease BN (tRNA processing enzyme)
VIAAISILALTTQVVLLGTGGEGPVARRAGPSTAIVVDGRAYLVDFGPGVVRRAAAAHDAGIAALNPVNLTHAFATQLQFERTGGYADLVFAAGALGRKQPLEIYGPQGVRTMTEHVLAAWKDEARNDAQKYRVNVHEIAPGIVYRDVRVTVTTLAGGYRFQTADRTIVIRSDATPSEAVVRQCNGCDVLLHEVRAQSVRQLSDIATRARPALLILQSFHPDENALNREMRNLYPGRFIVGHDLDVY